MTTASSPATQARGARGPQWPRARSHSIAAKAASTATPAAIAPFTWPCCHWTSEAALVRNSSASPAKVIVRARSVRRSAGRHGSSARPTAAAGATYRTFHSNAIGWPCSPAAVSGVKT